MPIRTLIITDYMGTTGETPEEEAERIVETFSKRFGLSLDYQHLTYCPDLGEYNPDFIIVDYGGLMPGSDSDVWTLREIGEWAREHPSKLVLIWTAFTARIWKYELEGHFKDLDNILLWVPLDPTGQRKIVKTDEEVAYESTIATKIAHWYGEV